MAVTCWGDRGFQPFLPPPYPHIELFNSPLPPLPQSLKRCQISFKCILLCSFLCFKLCLKTFHGLNLVVFPCGTLILVTASYILKDFAAKNLLVTSIPLVGKMIIQSCVSKANRFKYTRRFFYKKNLFFALVSIFLT